LGFGARTPYSLPPVPFVEGATAPPDPPVLEAVLAETPVPPERAVACGLDDPKLGAGVPPGESVAWATATDDALSVAQSSTAVVACAAAFLACLMH
jgi:hypothetical protein